MTPIKHILLIVAALCGLAGAAHADWVVVRVSQPAKLATDGETWHALTLGAVVPDRSWIHTGRTGRLLLRRGGDVIQFKPNTIAAVSDSPGGVLILQKFGAMIIDVDPGREGVTTLETPYLALLVKGTRFEVGVTVRSATVRVERGLVEVADLIDALGGEVRAGQSATAEAVPDGRLLVRGGSGGVTQMARPIPPRQPQLSAPRAVSRQESRRERTRDRAARGISRGAFGEDDSDALAERRATRLAMGSAASGSGDPGGGDPGGGEPGGGEPGGGDPGGGDPGGGDPGGGDPGGGDPGGGDPGGGDPGGGDPGGGDPGGGDPGGGDPDGGDPGSAASGSGDPGGGDPGGGDPGGGDPGGGDPGGGDPGGGDPGGGDPGGGDPGGGDPGGGDPSGGDPGGGGSVGGDPG